MEEMPQFSKVLYPGLRSHPQYDLAAKQMKGFSGMISARLRSNLNHKSCAQISEVSQLLKRLKIFALAESLGGVESLVNHPLTMTHASITAELRQQLGITPDLIRFSIGIEEAADWIRDIT